MVGEKIVEDCGKYHSADEIRTIWKLKSCSKIRRPDFLIPRTRIGNSDNARVQEVDCHLPFTFQLPNLADVT